MNTKDRIAQFRATPERMSDEEFEYLSKPGSAYFRGGDSGSRVLIAEARRARESEAALKEALDEQRAIEGRLASSLDKSLEALEALYRPLINVDWKRGPKTLRWHKGYAVLKKAGRLPW